MEIDEKYCEKDNIVEDMLACQPCIDIKKFNVTKCKGRKRKLEYYRREVPGLEYVMRKKMNYIFSSGMTAGSTENNVKLNEFLKRRNAQGVPNLQVLASAIEKADYWGECGLRRIGDDIYIVEPGTYQTATMWVNGVHIPVGYIISDKGHYLGDIKIDLDKEEIKSLDDIVEHLRSEGYIWIDADSSDFINLRNDTSKLHGDPAILRDKERLDLLISTYRRLNYDVVFDGPGRIVLRVKGGYLEAEEGQDLSAKKVVSETASTRINRRNQAIEEAKKIAKTIQNSSSDNVIVLGDEFDKNIEKLERVTKATEFFDWLEYDVYTVAQVLGFDGTLVGVSRFAGNVAMNAVIDDAILSCVIPLREHYSVQFSPLLANILNVEEVKFDKYNLRQTETSLDKLERVVNMIFKLQAGAKKDESADRTLENTLQEIANESLYNDNNKLKLLNEL